ncbi:udp-glucose 4-epimerase [hydrocarbon metagenome]|uniref:Udp-glucose 4-epimerase n=1 Tax=hydrocarbon metagenome TaxID=938273 RepID=A0A0W8G208_9ZZZZ
MLVLCRQEAASPPATAALFGLGLIGGQVAEALCAGGYARAACLPFAWGAAPERPRELADIMALLEASPGRLDVVWSAGAGGFGMSQAAADRELADFSDVLGLARTLAGRRTPGTVRFHLLSSAGGLFEGQRDVTPHTPPAPKRTYGVLKLRQEELLARAGELVRIVYRPSSVYGLAGPGRRMGLIPTLMANGARYRVSTIFGTPDTLRDYVHVADVARYVARQVGDDQGTSRTLILATARPTSLSEVLAAVERTLNRKIFITYRDDRSRNTAHITFSRKACPPGWRPEGIEIGVRTMWSTFRH